MPARASRSIPGRSAAARMNARKTRARTSFTFHSASATATIAMTIRVERATRCAVCFMTRDLSPDGERSLVMKQTAQRVALSTLIVIAIVAVALALWKVKLVLALVFLAFILAAALRPGIERLARAGIPRGFGLLVHYVLLIGV